MLLRLIDSSLVGIDLIPLRVVVFATIIWVFLCSTMDRWRTSEPLLAHLIACLWPLGKVAWHLLVSITTTRAVLTSARHVSLDNASILLGCLDYLTKPTCAPLSRRSLI